MRTATLFLSIDGRSQNLNRRWQIVRFFYSNTIMISTIPVHMSSTKKTNSNESVNGKTNSLNTVSVKKRMSQVNRNKMSEEGHEITPDITPFGVVSVEDQEAMLNRRRNLSFHNRIMEMIKTNKGQ